MSLLSQGNGTVNGNRFFWGLTGENRIWYFGGVERVRESKEIPKGKAVEFLEQRLDPDVKQALKVSLVLIAGILGYVALFVK
ncbi:hypothetical protein HYS82_03930 [Candidatus Amesbacteria bacterium]|nr:hypothetical protein [Candidatus Amesbacteria bacterium]